MRNASLSRFIIGCIVACVCVLLWSPAFAQGTSQINTDRLQRYYEDWLRAKSESAKSYNEQLIANERARIQALVQKEIEGIVSPLEKDTIATSDTGEELTTSTVIDRQREIVDELNGRLNEDTVDLNLLKEEEKLYERGETGTGSVPYMLTKSYPELLARKALLEESVDLFATTATAQQIRLDKLLSEQRAQTIGILLTVLWYVGVVFVVFWVEHFIRTQIILHLHSRRLRYALSKIFTLVVYVSLIVWLVQMVFVEHPGLTTVLAVIGAALVFMLQDIIKSFIAWFTYKDALTMGQRVHMGDYTGDVLDISMFFTKILIARSPDLQDPTKAGKIVRVPNSMLLSGMVVNYHSTSDFENVEIPIRLADPAQGAVAKAILMEVLEQEAAEYTEQAQSQMDRRMRGFYFSQVSPSHRVYLEWSSKGHLVCLLCFPAPIGLRRSVTTRVLEVALQRFLEEGIKIAEAE